MMTKVKICLQCEGRWEEVADLEVEVMPRVGEAIAFDDVGDTNIPPDDYIVYQVKHYHYLTATEKSEIHIFIGRPKGEKLELLIPHYRLLDDH